MASRRDDTSSEEDGIELGRRGEARNPVGRGDSRAARRSRESARREGEAGEAKRGGRRGGGSSSETDDEEAPAPSSAPLSPRSRARARVEKRRAEREARGGGDRRGGDRGVEMRRRPGDEVKDEGSGESGDEAAPGPRRGDGDGGADAFVDDALGRAVGPDGRRLYRPAAVLRWADAASVAATLALGWCFLAFQVLCLYDGQCVPSTGDPAILEDSYVARGLLAVLLICGFVVVPYVIAATDSARRMRILRLAGEDAIKRNRAIFWYPDRRCVAAATALAVGFGLCLAATAIERSAYRLAKANFGKNAKRTWDDCEDEAAPDGTWRERDDCPWTNDVKVYYDDAGALADARTDNIQHVVIFAAVESVLLFLCAVFLVLSWNSTTGFSGFGTGLRLKPRLIER